MGNYILILENQRESLAVTNNQLSDHGCQQKQGLPTEVRGFIRELVLLSLYLTKYKINKLANLEAIISALGNC